MFSHCQPAAGVRREARRRARREATTTRATSSYTYLLQLTTRSCYCNDKKYFKMDNWIFLCVPVSCSAYKLGFLFSSPLPSSPFALSARVSPPGYLYFL